MLGVRVDLLRSGGNQLGAVTTAAGLIAYFVEPVPDVEAAKLFASGVVIYFISALELRKATETDKTGK